MKIALDLDNTLIDFDSYYNSKYKSWAKAKGYSYSEAIPSEFNLDVRYGITHAQAHELHEDLFEYYCAESKLSYTALQFILTLQQLGYNPCIITHRYPHHVSNTYRQLSPLLIHQPDFPIYFASGCKSTVMKENGVSLIVDDASSVILDILDNPELYILSPKLSCNSGLPIDYFSGFDEALSLIINKYPIHN